jgi:hypothetical protein
MISQRNWNGRSIITLKNLLKSKKKFNHEEESVFVEKLPKGLKKEFLK